MMDERLAGAIEATRAGDTQLAQLQLTRLLKDEPNHAQGWYLLSMLVDSSEKKALFLKKVLAIDPDHAKAQEQLSVMSGAPAETAVSAIDTPIPAPTEVVDEAETGKQNYAPGVSELPSWLMEREDGAFLEEPPTQVSIPLPESNLGTIPAPPPLAEESPEESVEEPAATAVAPPPPVAKPKPKTKPAAANTQARTLNLAIIVLIVLALLISFLLIRELLF